jgi:3-hydroxyacyl-CoA dehydrogenase
MPELVLLTRHAGVGVITINNPPVNALSPGVPEGIVQGIDEFGADPAIRAIVLIGGGRTFISGADIKEFGKITAGQKSDIGLAQIIDRIEQSAKPVVMAIHGQALGGGLEVAMGGHYRVIAPTAKVGQPEVKLGIIPGAAGTQRLPRLAGIERALEMCWTGEPIDAPTAVAAGIADAIAEGNLLEFAIGFARTHPEIRRTCDLPVKPVDPAVFAKARAAAAKRARGLMAAQKAIDAVEASAKLPFQEGVAYERKLFNECLFSDQSKAMIHVFFGEREVAKIPGLAKDTPVLPVDSAAIVGAGTMGGGIAMCYLNAGIPVRLKETAPEALERGVAKIRKNYENSVAKGRFTREFVEQRLALLTPQLTYDGFDRASIIVEAVYENLALKQQVFAELDRIAKPGAILASNTSTLDIDAIAGATSRPEWVVGHHFFSPANVMRLLEIVRGKRTSDEVLATSMALAKTLKKVGVLVGNCFGFVGNRMFGPYRREAEQLVLEGASPLEVDQALYDYGMAMGPLAVGDLAGLDVGWRIRQERGEAGSAPIEDKLCEMGRYGQKTGAGWYRYDENRNPSPDPVTDQVIAEARAAGGYTPRHIHAEEIVGRCIGMLVEEGKRILAEGIALRPVDIDIIYVMGYGFPAYRGGPMWQAGVR